MAVSNAGVPATLFLALYRRVVRASRAIPVPYVRRKTVANFRDAHRLYSDPRYDEQRPELLERAQRSADTFERLMRLDPQTQMSLLFRKQALDEGARTLQHQQEAKEKKLAQVKEKTATRGMRKARSMAPQAPGSGCLSPSESSLSWAVPFISRSSDPDAPLQQPEASVCPECGQGFHCGAKAAAEKGVPCWCFSLPRVKAVPPAQTDGPARASSPDASTGCLCEGCLEKRIAAEQHPTASS